MGRALEYIRAPAPRTNRFVFPPCLLRMSLQTLSLVALLAAFVQSLPQSHTRVTYTDSKQHLRDDWVRVSSSHVAVSSSQLTHQLLFCVKQNNIPELKRLLESVSDPSSPRFQQYLSFSQVGDILNNTQGVTAVVDWLTAAGANVTSITSRGEYISASAPLAVWSQLLDTEFYTVTHVASSDRINRCNAYSLPHFIAQHVQSVAYTTQLPPRRQAPQPRQTATDKPVTNLAVLKKAYNLPADSANQTLGSQTIIAFNQYYSLKDLTTFAKQNGFNAPNITDDGGTMSDQKCASGSGLFDCEEDNLDLQYITAVAPGVPTTFWRPSVGNALFYDHLVAVASSDPAAPGAAAPGLVHSISYTSPESEIESSINDNFDTEMIKLALIGVTVLVASGDGGVADLYSEQSPSQCGYKPGFPQTSAYVTTVGGTQGIESGSPEIACSSKTGGQITTGGGFSFKYPQPKWQASAVAEYFRTARKAAPGYDKTKRGFPDVALAANNYELVVGGKAQYGSGTSASAPVFAGFVSLVNSARLAAGKPALGFLNPALYASNARSIYNDITSGENNCAAGDEQTTFCCKEGFYAAKGWDPLTGWGSVDFAKFAEQMI